MSIDQVLTAVQSLNAPNLDNTSRQQALKWLEHFQNTLEAWNVSLTILTLYHHTASPVPTSSTAGQVESLRFFASQTIKHKLVVDWIQLDETMIVRLKDQLLYLLLGAGEPSKAVRHQLILALATLAVQCPPSLWATPVDDLLNQCVAPNAMGDLQCLIIGILAGIPEQLDNSMLTGLSPTERNERRHQLVEGNVDKVIEAMGRLLFGTRAISMTTAPTTGESAVTDAVVNAALNCLNSWIRHGKSPRLVSSPLLLQNILARLKVDLQAYIQPLALRSNRGGADEIETCSEILCEMFYLLFQQTTTSTLTPTSPSEEYLRILFTGLVEILPSLKKIIRTRDGEDNYDDDDDERTNIILATGRVFMEAGEAFLSFIWGNGPALQVIIEAALELVCGGDTRHHNITATLSINERRIVEETFTWWAALEARSSAEKEEVRAPFLPVFATLFKGLVTRFLAYPLPPEDEQWSSEERDAFRDFRHVVGDCLKDCTRVLGSTETLLLARDLLKEANEQGIWQALEAILFALRTISSSVDGRESEALPNIFTVLLAPTMVKDKGSSSVENTSVKTLIHHHPKLVYAIILNIGCYAEWARYHPEFISPFLAYLLAGWRDHSPAVAMALRFLTESCARNLVHGEEETRLRVFYQQLLADPTMIVSRNMVEVTEAMANVVAEETNEGRLRNVLLPAYLNPWLTLLTPTSSLSNDNNPLILMVRAALENITAFLNIVTQGVELFASQLSAILVQLSNTAPWLMADSHLVDSMVLLIKAILVNHPGAEYGTQLIDLLDVLYSEWGVEGALYSLRMALLSEMGSSNGEARTSNTNDALASPSPAIKILNWPRFRLSLQRAIQAPRLPGPDFYMLFSTAIDQYPEEMTFAPSATASNEVNNVAIVLEVLDKLTHFTLLPPSHQADPAEVAMGLQFLLGLLHVLQRQKRKAMEQGIAATCGTWIRSGVWKCAQAMMEGACLLYPLNLMGDVASVLRNLYAWDDEGWGGMMKALLGPDGIPNSILLPKERQMWLERFEGVIVPSSRARDIKETMIAFVNVYRRRRPVTPA